MTIVNLNPPTFHPWMDKAKCAEVGGDAWFPDIGGDGGKAQIEICNTCPAKRQCLEFGMNAANLGYGIYGGKTPRQRKAIRNNENERARNKRHAS